VLWAGQTTQAEAQVQRQKSLNVVNFWTEIMVDQSGNRSMCLPCLSFGVLLFIGVRKLHLL
jgi:hypothetical protein